MAAELCLPCCAWRSSQTIQNARNEQFLQASNFTGRHPIIIFCFVAHHVGGEPDKQKDGDLAETTTSQDGVHLAEAVSRQDDQASELAQTTQPPETDQQATQQVPEIPTPVSRMSETEAAALREDWKKLKSQVEGLKYVGKYTVVTVAYRRSVPQFTRTLVI